MKKFFAFLFTLVLSFLLMTGCKKDEEKEPVKPNPEPVPVLNYTVSWYDETGSLISTDTLKEGSVPSKTYSKANTDEYSYTFKGWSATKGGEVLASLPKVKENVSYYAVVEATKNTFEVKVMSGTEVVSTSTLEYGESFSEPAALSKVGYEFTGWYKDKECTNKVSFPLEVKANTTIYAGWKVLTYTVKWYDESGTLIESEVLEYGKTPTHAFSKQNTDEYTYSFKGWAVEKNGLVLNKLPNVTKDAEYYAVVEAVKNQYTIYFDSKGGSSVNSITVPYGTSVDKPKNPLLDGFGFVAWVINGQSKAVEWPIVVTSNLNLYATWNETIDIKGYLNTLKEGTNLDPYGYIPESMRPSFSANNVLPEDINYDYSNFINVSAINFKGYGEQWNMVVTNIQQSEKFFSILSMCEAVLNTSIVAFNNWLDKNPSTTADHTLGDTTYTAHLTYSEGLLTYSLRYETNLKLPLFGEVTPQIDMVYNINTAEKYVRVQVTETNVMKYLIKENSYEFALEYGIDGVNRNAFFSLEKKEDNTVIGHIYEYVSAAGKDLIKSCADFIIGDDYTSVVGNKASGLIGFTGYINELYDTKKGTLLGYEVREELKTIVYHTFFFNLNDVTQINTIKALPTEDAKEKNPHHIYINGSSTIFEPKYNQKLMVKTSRKFDIELRKRYYYEFDVANDEYIQHEVLIPMMFVQAGDNFSTFEDDIFVTNNIHAQINIKKEIIDKIELDHNNMIDIFIQNKDTVTAETIKKYIGSAAVIK